MIIASSTGNIGVGTTPNATDKFTVFGDIRTGNSATNGCVKNFAGTGLIGSCASDERLKQNIQGMGDVMGRLSQVGVVTYQWNDLAASLFGNNTSAVNTGVIAQNVASLFPELVTTEADGYERTVSPTTGRSSYSAPSGGHDDTVISRALMLWQAAHYVSSYVDFV
jgi:hypothetical protein